ncbi:unnamed protein product [Phytophthora fragariaefolia]|uniref:Unnamed protein product n=1 Tax=Phytophthora fragariaefolia TaxID=1490495 RepID=A0A9W6XMS8_9STRA|nr:unnamed protein product [Phytophthora fragariaefolia]
MANSAVGQVTRSLAMDLGLSTEVYSDKDMASVVDYQEEGVDSNIASAGATLLSTSTGVSQSRRTAPSLSSTIAPPIVRPG